MKVMPLNKQLFFHNEVNQEVSGVRNYQYSPLAKSLKTDSFLRREVLSSNISFGSNLEIKNILKMIAEMATLLAGKTEKSVDSGEIKKIFSKYMPNEQIVNERVVSSGVTDSGGKLLVQKVEELEKQIINAETGSDQNKPRINLSLLSIISEMVKDKSVDNNSIRDVIKYIESKFRFKTITLSEEELTDEELSMCVSLIKKIEKRQLEDKKVLMNLADTVLKQIQEKSRWGDCPKLDLSVREALADVYHNFALDITPLEKSFAGGQQPAEKDAVNYALKGLKLLYPWESLDYLQGKILDLIGISDSFMVDSLVIKKLTGDPQDLSLLQELFGKFSKELVTIDMVEKRVLEDSIDAEVLEKIINSKTYKKYPKITEQKQDIVDSNKAQIRDYLLNKQKKSVDRVKAILENYPETIEIETPKSKEQEIQESLMKEFNIKEEEAQVLCGYWTKFEELEELCPESDNFETYIRNLIELKKSNQYKTLEDFILEKFYPGKSFDEIAEEIRKKYAIYDKEFRKKHNIGDKDEVSPAYNWYQIDS